MNIGEETCCLVSIILAWVPWRMDMLYIWEDNRRNGFEQVPKAGIVGSGHERVYMLASPNKRHLTAFAFPPASTVSPAN